MNFVESFNLLGTEAKEIPSVKGAGVPTEATEGAVGCLYMNTDNGDLYKCTAVDGGKYTWEMVGNGGVKTVNGIAPDENGNIKIDTGGTGSANGQVTIEGTDIEKTCSKFARLFYGTDKVESFLFFTDPHLIGLDPHEDEMHEYLSALKTYYDATPSSFVVCGGDWLENNQTLEEACFKLGYADSWMRANFNNYYPVIGNHDNNSYGKLDSESAKYTGGISENTLRNLVARQEGGLYYSFDGVNTKGYVLNSSELFKEGVGDDDDSIMSIYKWGQVEWLAEKLASDNAENAVIFIHVGYRRKDYTSPYPDYFTIGHLAQKITQLCQAYNNRQTGTLKDSVFALDGQGTYEAKSIDYDFSSCTGCVRFILSGHVHTADAVQVHNDIPVISTPDIRSGGMPTFDLCLADYDNNVLHMVRVGDGYDRSVAMGGIGATKNTYRVTLNLTGYTASNTKSFVPEDSLYTNIITPDEGYALDSLVVTMGGVNITNSVYSNGVITIENVTGDIEIKSVTYRNQLVNAEFIEGTQWAELDTSPYGYINGYVIKDDAGCKYESATYQAPYVSTGAIPCPTERTPLYIKGADWLQDEEGAEILEGTDSVPMGAFCKLYTFKTIDSTPSKVKKGAGNNNINIRDWTFEKLGDKYWKCTPNSNWQTNSETGEPYYYRLSLYGNINAENGDELIITHGEPIE